ncbi:MAG TPA: branched-chain amino acid ABC transporter permease [Gammaproteobacteria bacterium]|nr:branched-chain amino acid ABC transporter permease [Gammaproteobacteria bacterium]
MAAVAFVLVPAFHSGFATDFAGRLIVLGLLALSFDLAWGYTGILSFGQALFFGAGGYAAALVATRLDVTSVFLALPISVVAGAVFSFAAALLLLMGKRPPTVIFVALGTLAGSFAAETLAAGWNAIGAANGIPSVPYLTIHGAQLRGVPFYYVILGLAAVIYIGSRLLVRSQLGLVLAGIRQQEARLLYLGYSIQRVKALVFVFSGAIAGLSGALFVFHAGYASPEILGVLLSTKTVFYVFFGGVGALIGSIYGVAIVEICGNILSQAYPNVWPVLLGAILLLVVMFRPSGLIGLVVPLAERVGSFGGRDGNGKGPRENAQAGR